MLTQDMIAKISSGRSDSSGRFCQYIRVTDSIGFKFFSQENKETEKQSYVNYMQAEYLYNLGLGPRVWNFTEIEKGVIYGYFVEHCEVNNEPTSQENREIYAFERKANCILQDEGIMLKDVYYGNVGLLDGEFKIIDSGCIGTIDYHKYPGESEVLGSNFHFSILACRWK